MTEVFEPALLTVLYWFFVGTIAVCGFTAYRMARWARVDHSHRTAL